MNFVFRIRLHFFKLNFWTKNVCKKSSPNSQEATPPDKQKGFKGRSILRAIFLGFSFPILPFLRSLTNVSWSLARLDSTPFPSLHHRRLSWYQTEDDQHRKADYGDRPFVACDQNNQFLTGLPWRRKIQCSQNRACECLVVIVEMRPLPEDRNLGSTDFCCLTNCFEAE